MTTKLGMIEFFIRDAIRAGAGGCSIRFRLLSRGMIFGIGSVTHNRLSRKVFAKKGKAITSKKNSSGAGFRRGLVRLRVHYGWGRKGRNPIQNIRCRKQGLHTVDLGLNLKQRQRLKKYRGLPPHATKNDRKPTQSSSRTTRNLCWTLLLSVGYLKDHILGFLKESSLGGWKAYQVRGER